MATALEGDLADPGNINMSTQAVSFFHWRVMSLLADVTITDGGVVTRSETIIKGADFGPDISTEVDAGEQFPGGWNRTVQWSVAPDYLFIFQFLCPIRRYVPGPLVDGNPTWYADLAISVTAGPSGAFINTGTGGLVAAGSWTINGVDPITGLDFTTEGAMFRNAFDTGSCDITFTPNGFYSWSGKYNTSTGALA